MAAPTYQDARKVAYKRIPNADEQAFIEDARRIREGRLSDTSELTCTGKLRENAEELALAFKEDGEDAFWKLYDIFTVEHPRMGEWIGAIKTVSAPDEKPEETPYQLYPLSHFRSRPKKEWGVEKIVYDRGISLFVGDGGSGKSTLVLDMYLGRACNRAFIGRAVKPAFVVWIAAESIEELWPRAAACLACHNLSEDAADNNFLVLDGRMPFNNTAEVELFIQSVQKQLSEAHVTPETHSIVFVFDTYARCTPGGDENNTQETKLIADSMLSISDAFRCHVTVIHHVNAQGRIRGNTALRDAIDTLWIVTKEGDRIKLHCDKMRGSPEPEDFSLVMRSIVLDENNPDETAPVVSASEEDSTDTETFTPKTQKQMLEILKLHGQLTPSQWQKHCETLYQISNGAFYNHLKNITKGEFVSMPPKEERTRGKRVYYSLSEKGALLVG